MKYPELIFTDDPLEKLLTVLADSNTLLVTDPRNYPSVKNYGKTIMVKNNFYALSYEDMQNNAYNRVIGIGGCSALDIGRIYAEGIKFIAIPTVLSTSCISVNISILRAKDETKRIKTVIPDRTIISFPELFRAEEKDLKKWSSSGFGDLFANISASIDFEYKNNSFSLENIYKNAEEAFSAMEWVLSDFNGYNNYDTLKKLATYLHNSSLDVIRRGNNELSAGCEHKFYETIIRQQIYSNQIQTHGILVSIGTLITILIFEKLSQNKNIFSKLKEAYKKLGLPVNYKEFLETGIEKIHIIEALKNSGTKNIMSDYFAEGDFSIMEDFNDE